MAGILTTLRGHSLALDACAACKLVWFDRSELDAVPKAGPRDDLTEKQLQEIAYFETHVMRPEQEKDGVFAYPNPAESWQWIPMLLELPVECNAPPCRCRPWATWTVTGMLVFVFMVTCMVLEVAIEQWGFVPALSWRHGGATILTSFFLHVGLLHLLGNAYFLLIFGDNVEDDLGWPGFLLLLGAAHLAGTAVAGLADPRAMMPSVGASAGIAGVLAYYSIVFPRVRIAMFFRFAWVRLPAWVFLILFLALQSVGALLQVYGFGNVSYLGHLGGLGVGAAAALLVRSMRAQAAELASKS
jgi:membrane associated rhomboid family serine protease